ncbi:MAG: SDR family oxidoreductase [Dehalococcoidales bacterium]|nr:SDR family oxidoreductase [Dehalococcoidales bacterium]
MGKFNDRSAIITGGGSGIGRACALKLSEEGARVMIGDIRTELAEETADLVRSTGGEACFVHCDVGNEEDVETMTLKTIEEFGGLNILVSNAGTAARGGIHETSLDDWERIIRVQLTGTFLCARAALRHMINHGGGSIITIGSISSVVIGPGGSAASYKAAKGGILQLTRAIATEYAHKGVRANCVCPGAVSTNLGKHIQEDSVNWTSDVRDEVRSYKMEAPMMRRADPMEVANVVAFLASDESSFMTGSAVMVDGGYTAI